MDIRVVVAGAGGRMGHRVISQINAAEDMTLSGALERPDYHALGDDAGLQAGVSPLGVFLTEDAVSLEGDVAVSFAIPEASVAHARLAEEKGMPLVIGTTGFSEDQLKIIESCAENIPCVLSPNMSIGVNVSFRLIEEAAQLLGSDYDVEILEAHHNQKMDAPSGTAVRMGQILSQALGRKYPDDAVFHREGQIGKRGPMEIGIQTLRGGDVTGDHTVYFFGTGERIEITHRATSRDNFASGVIRAIRWIVGQSPGVYGMNQVLGI